MATTAADTWATAVARSALYGLLARGLAYPAPHHRHALDDHLLPTVARVRPADDELARELDAVVGHLGRPLDELQRAHAAVFTIIESRDCPTYETAYRGRDIFRQAQLMADVAGFYRAHGLRVGRAERERPDHITVELEFMSFMAAKEAYARAKLGDAQVQTCRRTEALFLRDHLGAWGPGFGRRLTVVSGHELYRSIGRLVAAWLTADMEHLDVTPEGPVDTPLPQPPPDDEACGPTSMDDATSCGGQPVRSGVTWPVHLTERPP